MDKEDILANLEDLLRTMPSRREIRTNNSDVLIWIGRAAAIISEWRPAVEPKFSRFIDGLNDSHAIDSQAAFRGLFILLNQARSDLQMKTMGPLNIALSGSSHFEYFDEIRKIIELSKIDILFVDPYLDAEFVSRYLPNITNGVTIRLLAREKLKTLLPAVKMFVAQYKENVEVRSAPNFHDRYVFVDENGCYQSGASFKDGAKKSPTTITQITDAFDAVYRTYQDIWARAKVEFLR